MALNCTGTMSSVRTLDNGYDKAARHREPISLRAYLSLLSVCLMLDSLREPSLQVRCPPRQPNVCTGYVWVRRKFSLGALDVFGHRDTRLLNDTASTQNVVDIQSIQTNISTSPLA